MFQKAKSIEGAFRHVRLFTMLVIVAMFLICGLVSYKSYVMVMAAQKRIYVLSGGKSFEARATDREDNIPVEARDHVTVFHSLFFTLDPDDKVIQSNITKALYLADATAQREYHNLKERGYYSGIISANISQRMQVDSVSMDITVYPYFFRFYGRQVITRTTSTITRSLITEGTLRNVSRSDNNPHGFLIERWATVENRDINSQSR